MNPFPIQYFPPSIRDAVEGIRAYKNAPPELTATIALGIASHAVQGLWNATAHRFDTNTSNFFIVLMESGGLKSEITKMLDTGKDRYEQTMKDNYTRAMARYAAENEDWEIRKSRARKNPDDVARVQELIDIELERPVKPFSPKRRFEAPTVVGLTRAFQNSGPSLGMFSTDAGTFLSGTAMADAAQAKQMVSIMSKVWSGESYDRQTGDEQLSLENKRITCLWLVQGVMASEFLSSPVFGGQGILARFIVVKAPRFETEDAKYAEDDGRDAILKAQAVQASERFNNRIYELLMEGLALKTGTSDELDPPIFPWDASVLKMQQDWVNGFCKPYRNGCSDDDENRSFYQRLEEHCARIATVMAVVEGKSAVDHASALGAQKLIEWVTTELQQLDKSYVADSDEMKAFKALRGFIESRKGAVVKERDLIRNGRAAFAKARDQVREAALRRAEAEGLVERGIAENGRGRSYAVVTVSDDVGIWS